MKLENLKVVGMTGEACAVKVEQALKAIGGVDHVSVSLGKMEAAVKYDDKVASVNDFKSALQGAGFDVEQRAQLYSIGFKVGAMDRVRLEQKVIKWLLQQCSDFFRLPVVTELICGFVKSLR